MIWLTIAAIGVGLFFLVVAAIGMVRMPDVFSRSHALALTDTLGASLVLIGLALQQGWTLTAGKTVVVLILLLLLNPVISHATLRAALRAGLQPWKRGT